MDAERTERYTVEDREAESRYVLIDTDPVGTHEAEGSQDSAVADRDSATSASADPAGVTASTATAGVTAPAGDTQATVIGEESYADFESDGQQQRIFFHTAVSDAYAGQGLASILVGAAVEHAVAGGRVIVPVCPYVAAWFKKHPEHADHAVAVRPEHLAAIERS